MRNIFKNHKSSETPKVESIEELPVAPVETLEPKKELVDSEAIDVRLEALVDYFDQCEKNGIEMTQDMVQTEIKERLGLEVEELLGEEITNPELKATHNEIVGRIKEVMSQKAEEKGTPLSFLREKVFKSKAAKAAFVTALLFLKFNPLAAAEHKESKENIKDKIEHETKKPVSHDGGDGKTFKAGVEDFITPEGNIVISATHNFETDKADLKDAEHLSEEFNKFLSSIDRNNFNDLINQDWTVKGSSDERHTNWAGGNEGLTQARIDAVVKVIEQTLANHNFTDKLTSEQIKQIAEKKITEIYPTHGAEKGVTYLTDLANPVTGHNFTDAEVKNIKETNPSEYHKLLDQCRYTNFELEVAKSVPVIDKMVSKVPKIETSVKIPEPPKIFSPEVFDKYYLLVDDSPSMGGTKKNMAKELTDLNIVKPFMVAHYSADLSKISTEKNSEEAAKKIMKMDTEHSSSTELSLSSAIKFLEKIEKQEQGAIEKNEVLPHGVMYVATDETLQDVNKLQKLVELGEKTNTKIEFLIFYSHGGKVLKLGLDDIQKQIDKKNIFKVGDRLLIKKLVDADGKVVISL